MDSLYSNRWLNFAALASYFFFAIMQLSLFNVMAPLLIINFKITNIELGFISSSYLYTLALTLLPAGYLLDRYSIRQIILITLSLSVTSIYLLVIKPCVAVLTIYRMMAGISNGIAFLAALKIVSDLFPKKNALASSIMIAIGMTGGVLAPLFFAHLLLFSLDISLLVNTIIGLFIVWFIFNFFTHKVTSINVFSADLFKSVLTNSQNWYCGIYTGLLNLSVYLIGALWGNIYLTQRYHLANTTASGISAMIFLGLIIGSPLWGWISDFISSRKIPMFLGAFSSLIIMLFIMNINIPSPDLLSFLFLSLGLTTSAQVLSYPTISEANAKSLIGMATGFAGIFINLIGAVAQPFFGWLLFFFGTEKPERTVLTLVYNLNDLKLAMSSLIFAFGLACIVVVFINPLKR